MRSDKDLNHANDLLRQVAKNFNGVNSDNMSEREIHIAQLLRRELFLTGIQSINNQQIETIDYVLSNA